MLTFGVSFSPFPGRPASGNQARPGPSRPLSSRLSALHGLFAFMHTHWALRRLTLDVLHILREA